MATPLAQGLGEFLRNLGYTHFVDVKSGRSLPLEGLDEIVREHRAANRFELQRQGEGSSVAHFSFENNSGGRYQLGAAYLSSLTEPAVILVEISRLNQLGQPVPMGEFNPEFLPQLRAL